MCCIGPSKKKLKCIYIYRARPGTPPPGGGRKSGRESGGGGTLGGGGVTLEGGVRVRVCGGRVGDEIVVEVQGLQGLKVC
jgi:hypothetical protein